MRVGIALSIDEWRVKALALTLFELCAMLFSVYKGA